MISSGSSHGWTFAILCLLIIQSVLCTGNYGGCSGCPESYSFNGTHNNQYYPYWGAAGTTLVQKFGTHFGGDGSGNSLVDYPTDLCCRTEPNFITQFEKASLRGLNQAQVIFGQFAWTHDLTNVLNNNADPSLQYESCLSFIHPRKEIKPGSNPRQIVNHATSFLDLGPIYGPSEEISAQLRSFEGGKLLEDPYTHSLITDCELRGIPLDLVGKDPSEFLCAGDDRANENAYLTLITLMFVREHNRLADEYHVLYPHWNDDQLFCRARAMNIAQYQQISFYEWLPTVLGHEYFYSHYLQNYPGYDPHVNPGYFAESSASVFRFAHSMTPSKVLRIDQFGEQSKVSLAAMANDGSFLVTWGPEDWIRGISRTQAQNVGPFYPPELTNFDNPKLFDLHLFAADCFRSRDFGIWDFNTIRDKLGLPKVTSYADITHSFINQAILFQAYGGSVDNLDLFVAGMLESYAPGGSIVGETFQKLIHLQAEVVRTGDRFWFENPDYKTLSQYEKEKAKSATLAKIFLRNSDIQCLQSQVMKMPTLSEKICKSPSGHIPV